MFKNIFILLFLLSILAMATYAEDRVRVNESRTGVVTDLEKKADELAARKAKEQLMQSASALLTTVDIGGSYPRKGIAEFKCEPDHPWNSERAEENPSFKNCSASIYVQILDGHSAGINHLHKKFRINPETNRPEPAGQANNRAARFPQRIAALEEELKKVEATGLTGRAEDIKVEIETYRAQLALAKERDQDILEYCGKSAASTWEAPFKRIAGHVKNPGSCFNTNSEIKTVTLVFLENELGSLYTLGVNLRGQDLYGVFLVSPDLGGTEEIRECLVEQYYTRLRE